MVAGSPRPVVAMAYANWHDATNEQQEHQQQCAAYAPGEAAVGVGVSMALISRRHLRGRSLAPGWRPGQEDGSASHCSLSPPNSTRASTSAPRELQSGAPGPARERVLAPVLVLLPRGTATPHVANVATRFAHLTAPSLCYPSLFFLCKSLHPSIPLTPMG